MRAVKPHKLQHQPALPRMLKALQRAKGDFALFFAECNLPSLQQEAASWLAKNLEPAPLSLNLRDCSDELDALHLDEWLMRCTEGAATDAVIFLFGLELLLPTQDAEQLLVTVQQLNWRRGFFSRLKRPLVIWLPQYALNLLADQTPDFYDWYSGVFVFTADEITRLDAESLAFQSMAEQGVHSGDRSSLAEKKQWLHTLKSLLDEHTQPDATRAHLLGNMARLYHSIGTYHEALTCYQQSLNIQQQIGDKAGKGATLNDISQVHMAFGDYFSALNYLDESLAIRRHISDRVGEGATLNNMASIAYARGDYAIALSYLEQSLAIRQEIGDKAGEGATLNNLSQIFKAQGEYTTALSYLQQSLALTQQIGDKAGEGTALNNISQIYAANGDYDTALNYLEQALVILQEIGGKAGEGKTLNNIAQIFKARGDYATALQYLEQSLVIRREIGDKAGLCTTLFNIGHIHWQNNDPAKAMQSWVEVYQIAKEIQLAQALQELEKLAPQVGLEEGLQGWEKRLLAC